MPCLVRHSCTIIQFGVRLTSDTGYLNLIQAGYFHRDISIGSVLWQKNGQSTEPMQAEDEGSIGLLLQDGRIGGLCRGFVIDGDMGVKLETYLGQQDLGAKSVRLRCPC
jgi:hypothetical protein